MRQPFFSFGSVVEHEAVEAPEESGERLAGSRRGEDQRAFADVR